MNDAPSHPSASHILVAVGGPDHFWPLLSLGYALAKADGGRLTVLSVDRTDTAPEWLVIPSAFDALPITVEISRNQSPAKAILSYAKNLSPDLLLVGWRKTALGSGYHVGGTLDTILRQAPCNVCAVRADPKWPATNFDRGEKLRVLVPAAGGPNAPLAMDLALKLTDTIEVTALRVAPEHTDTADFLEHQRQLTELTLPWEDNPHLIAKTIRAESVLKGILAEAKTHDITILGASGESIFNQIVFGVVPQQVGLKNPNTTIIVKRFDGSMGSALNRVWWRATHTLPALTVEERTDVYKQIRRGARPKADFFVMIGLASAIAALGLMLNSPAVIIGAMLVAPLMSAIMGLGLGAIQADGKLLQLAGSAAIRGIALAIVVGFFSKLIIPTNGEVPAEIVSRTAPSLLDLGVALVSGLAGAYALSRKDMSSSLPGVAISAALVPPLSTVGIGIAWLKWDIAGGALLLFFTNLVAIVAASGLIFFLLGFRPQLRRQGRSKIFKRAVISSAVLLALMIWVLGSLTAASYRKAAQKRQIDTVLLQEINQMEGDVTLDSWKELSPDNDTFDLEVLVRSSSILSHQSVVALQERVAAALKYPTALTLITIRTTRLNPLVPPTPTRTATPGPTPTATNTSMPTATLSPTPSPFPKPSTTATPTCTPYPQDTATPTASATPTATNTQSPTATATPRSAVVAYTGGRGVVLRWSPGGLRAGAIPENTPVQVLYRHAETDGLNWVEVRDPAGRVGWVAARYLVVIP